MRGGLWTLKKLSSFMRQADPAFACGSFNSAIRKSSADILSKRVFALSDRLFCGIVAKPRLITSTASSTSMHYAVNGAAALPVTLEFEIRVSIA